MEYYKNRICVTVEELTTSEGGEAIMSVPDYRYYSNRNHFRFMRRGGGLGCYALVEFESLPPRIKNRFIDKYGHPKDVLKERPVSEELLVDGAAREFYRTWRLPDGTSIAEEQQADYTRNASVLNELIRIINDRRSKRRAYGFRAADFWDSIQVTLEGFREYPGHTLPGGKAQLQNKINDYKKDGYAALISGKLGNNNSIKITKEMGDQIVALKRCRVPIYSNKEIFEAINLMAAERGWKPLRSEKSLVQFLHREDIEPRWWDAVHGELEAHNRYSRKNRTWMASVRDATWYGDGTKLNLYYKAYSGKELVVRTTAVYEVMDAYSEAFLGYHISDNENFDQQYRAFRMAVENYRQRPYEIVVDGQGGHKKAASTGFLDRIKGNIARRTAPYNPSGKSIESAFGRFQAQVLHRDWRFTGQNITAKSQASRENREFVEANKEHLYTLEELREAYARARQEWNMSLHPVSGRPRLSMYLDSRNEKAVPVSQMDLMEMFWLNTDKPVQFTPSGITIQVNKQKYSFEVFDAETGLPDLTWRRDNTYRKFVVAYDPLDMTHVRLYSKDASGGLRYSATAYPYACFAKAIQEQTPDDAAFIRTMTGMVEKERIQRQMEAAELETNYGVAPEQHGLNRPRIKGISPKTVERVMAELSRQVAPAPDPHEEQVDVGLLHKHLSNLTPIEMGSHYDKY